MSMSQITEHQHGNFIHMYPASNYTFQERENQPEEDASVAGRMARLEEQFNVTGIRRSVEAVIIVSEHGFPHSLTLQVANSYYKLPGGYLDPSESDEEGLITRLNETFGEPDGKGGVKAKKQDWVVGELLSTWWRPKFDNYMAGLFQLEGVYPYLPPQFTQPKEIKKLYLVHMPPKKTFFVPLNMKLRAMPVFEFYDNAARYGPTFAGLPHFLSRFRFEQHERVLAKMDAPEHA